MAILLSQTYGGYGIFRAKGLVSHFLAEAEATRDAVILTLLVK